MNNATPYRKIYDYAKNPIIGGKINEYWQATNVKKIFSQTRKPTFEFNPDYDYLNQEQITNKFKFTGLEYGNWVTQEERYNFLVCSHVSLYDLMKVLGFKNLGFNKISVAFGARGSGSAAAHFEPCTFAINLTRKSGWHSLAHEYGHALDYYFGGYIDQHPKIFSLSGGTLTAHYLPLDLFKTGSIRYLMNDLINTINTVVVNGKREYSSSFLCIKDADDYWRHRTEIFARFFEKYVQYKLNKKGISNTFLAKEKYERKIYVNRIDFNRALPKMEKLISAIRTKVNS